MNTLPALVFLHYFGGASESWEWVAEPLSKDFECVVPDLPGFGGRAPLPTPTIKNFAHFVQEEINRRKIENFVLIGHSMGAKIALQTAVLPEMKGVSHIILIAPSPPDIEPMPEDEKERLLIHPDKKQAEKSVKNSVRSVLSPEKRDLAIATQLIADHTTWKWWIEVGMNHSIVNEVKGIQIPITILASEDDPVITWDTLQKHVLQTLPQANLKKITNVGHLIPMEASEWVIEQIRDVCNLKQ